MKSLRNWFRLSKVKSVSAPRRSSVRPTFEALEGRQLMSALSAPWLNAHAADVAVVRFEDDNVLGTPIYRGGDPTVAASLEGGQAGDVLGTPIYRGGEPTVAASLEGGQAGDVLGTPIYRGDDPMATASLEGGQAGDVLGTPIYRGGDPTVAASLEGGQAGDVLGTPIYRGGDPMEAASSSFPIDPCMPSGPPS